MGEPSQIGASERWVVCGVSSTASARRAVVSADDDPRSLRTRRGHRTRVVLGARSRRMMRKRPSRCRSSCRLPCARRSSKRSQTGSASGALAPGASAGCRSRWISSKWTRLTCPPTSRLLDLPPLPRRGLRDVVAADSTRRLWKQEAPPLRGLGKASPPRPRWRGHRLVGSRGISRGTDR
jgi:hypothetical protein